MTALFVLLLVALSGLVVSVLTGNWPFVGLCSGLTLLAAVGIVALHGERRRS